MIMRCRGRNEIIVNARWLSYEAKAIAIYQNKKANKISNPVHDRVSQFFWYILSFVKSLELCSK
jgi:hypothetical protein